MADELNVRAVEPLSVGRRDLVDYSAKGNFRALGKRFGKQTPAVAAAIAAADADSARRRAGRATAGPTVDRRGRGRRGAAPTR